MTSLSGGCIDEDHEDDGVGVGCCGGNKLRVDVVLAGDASLSGAIRSGRSRCPTIGSSARSPASPSTATITSGSSIGPSRWSTTRRRRMKDPPATRCCKAAPARHGVRRRRQSAASLGRARRRLRMAEERARHFRRRRRQCLARRQRQSRPSDPEIHAGRENSCSRSAKSGSTGGSNSHDPARPSGRTW